MVILFHSTLNFYIAVTSVGGEHRLAGDGVTVVTVIIGVTFYLFPSPHRLQVP